jgi:hypothetical protein
MDELPMPAKPTPPDVLSAEVLLDAKRRPQGVRLNGVLIPRVIRATRRWNPGEIPTLVIEVEPTFFAEIDQDQDRVSFGLGKELRDQLIAEQQAAQQGDA